MLGFVDHHLSREPEESDVVHDLLAMLAEEMMRLNKEKRAAQREFLDWLVATLKILPDKEGRKGIDVLTGKGKVMDYPGDYQKDEPPLATGELLDILQKNKGRLGVSLSDSALVDRLRREYEESLEKVLPLKERLAQTDRLIDAVVYRLYGLTEGDCGGGGKQIGLCHLTNHWILLKKVIFRYWLMIRLLKGVYGEAYLYYYCQRKYLSRRLQLLTQHARSSVTSHEA